MRTAPSKSCPLDPIPTCMTAEATVSRYCSSRLSPLQPFDASWIFSNFIETGPIPAAFEEVEHGSRPLIVVHIGLSQTSPTSPSSLRVSLSSVSRFMCPVILCSRLSSLRVVPVIPPRLLYSQSTTTLSGNKQVLLLGMLDCGIQYRGPHVLYQIPDVDLTPPTELLRSSSLISTVDLSVLYIMVSRLLVRKYVDCRVLQGPILGSVEFVVYREDIADVVDKPHVQSHFDADDTQLYDSCRPQDISDIRNRLFGCI
jgi:hypothetical protein